MIKFFRHIRQKLLSENKFSKYLIYANGEIVLVVIGILFALQINNWNEAEKRTDEEQRLLRELIINLKQDIIDHKAIVEFNKAVAHPADYIIETIENRAVWNHTI